MVGLSTLRSCEASNGGSESASRSVPGTRSWWYRVIAGEPLPSTVVLLRSPSSSSPSGVGMPQSVSVKGKNLARWVHGPARDTVLAFVWIPFAVAAAALLGGPSINVFITAVFLLSFAHQPLTVALVYGDAEQFRLRRQIFTWSPGVFALAIYAAVHVNMLLLAVIGGLWNAEHTLMQRYGITRIYGRKSGNDDGRLEKAMLFSFLVFALVWVAADPATPAHLAAVDIGENNRLAVEFLAELRNGAVWFVGPTAALAAVLLVMWVIRERSFFRSGTANPAKWIYIGATVALFAMVFVNPIAALMGYVGAHAVEYFVIVHQSLGRRYGDAQTGGVSPLARAVRARPGRLGFFTVYVAIVIGIVMALQVWGSPVLYAVVFFTLGGLHVFYDGFIWKLRRPAVAASLAIPSVGVSDPA